MKKPQGRSIIMIDELIKPENKIEYYHVEVFDKNPLKGLKRKYTPTEGDRIFIYPDSNIPRFKLKKFCDKYKVSIAKVKETANVFFMDDELANNNDTYYESDYYPHIMYKDYFLDYIKRSSKVGDIRYIKLIEDLTNSQENVIYLRDYYTFQQQGLNKHKLDVIREEEEDDDDNIIHNCLKRDKIYFIKTEEQRQAFAEIDNKDYYHPDAMLALLNEGSVIDKEMYDGIMNLFESNDGVDHNVAMEAMANCDYQKSAVYLLMIFYHKQNKIYDSSIKNHVNFKSYLNFFKLAAARRIDIDDVVNKLKDKKLLNSSNLATVMKEARKVIKNNIESQTDYFIFTDIAPVEEIQKEVAETDAEDALAAQPQVTIAPTLDSCPGAFKQSSEVSQPQIDVTGLTTTPILDL